jgi:hypothetical protein
MRQRILTAIAAALLAASSVVGAYAQNSPAGTGGTGTGSTATGAAGTGTVGEGGTTGTAGTAGTAGTGGNNPAGTGVRQSDPGTQGAVTSAPGVKNEMSPGSESRPR